jgi:RsiW-degrading membrane proteinase PrsW (M82 family)
MSGPVQIAVLAGVVLLLVHFSLRRCGSRDVRVSELFQIVALAISLLLLPGAAEMVFRALGRSPLPIFNTAEDRLTLILGAAAVIAGIVDENIKALRESWDGRSN